MEKHGLIKDSQHGFVQHWSYLTNVIVFFEEVMKIIDDDRVVDLAAYTVAIHASMYY